MSGVSQRESDDFNSRLCYSLVGDILKQVELELLEIKSVRFLCNYPWLPGKRLRPIIFLLSNLAYRLEKSQPMQMNGRESRLAAAIELLHEASLVHDDLVDRSAVRRGAPSMQMVNGEGLALIIGDYMVFRGLKLVLDAAESREDIVLAQELANTGVSIAHGEADQLDRFLREKNDEERMSLDNYMDLIGKKTAMFFAGCAESGVALAGADMQTRLVYREFGMNLGLLFQMTDDLIDIMGDPKIAQKSLRNNLAEGTVTLPMLHAWQLYPSDKALQALASGQPIGARAQAQLYRLLSSEPVVALTQETMAVYAKRAWKGLERMQNNIYRMGLADMLDFVERCPWGGLKQSTTRKGQHATDG